MRAIPPGYYENEFAPRVFMTRPVQCVTRGDVEVHMLTCERDKVMAFWALKTFYHYSGVRFPLVVHDDGSLTDTTVALFVEHFEGCRVVRYADAENDAALRAKFAHVPLCRMWRWKTRPPAFAMRVFDLPHFAQSPYILQFDSDVLFFQRPAEVLACCADGEPFMATDYRSSYAFPISVARNALGIDLRAKVNVGLGGFPRTMIDYPTIERILDTMKATNVPPGIFRARHPWVEQTVTACLFSRLSRGRMLGVERYQLSSMLISDRTVYQHFVGDGSRPFFYDWGLSHLDEIGLLRELT